MLLPPLQTAAVGEALVASVFDDKAKLWGAVGVWEVSRPTCGCCGCSARGGSLALPIVASWCLFLVFMYAWAVEGLGW